VIGMILAAVTSRSVAPARLERAAIDFRGAALFLVMTVLITLFLDQNLAEVIGAAAQALLVAAFFAALWLFIRHEKSGESPMIDLSFFKVPAFGFGSAGLLMCCITQGITTFVTPFYLQDVLKLAPTFIGVIFLVPSILSMVLSPISGVLTDRIGARSLLMLGILVLMGAFTIGACLGAQSSWIWPTLLLGLTGIGAALFNTPSQAAMIASLPKAHWGTAIGIINAIFGLGHMLGISLTGIFLTIAFRYFSGLPGTIPNPEDAQVFVASLNVTYLFALGISLIPLLTSFKMKKTS
jgi:MFS family permease